MNQYVQTATIIGVQIIVAAFVYGQLTQKVKDLTSWSKDHNEQLTKHADRLMNHEGRIAHIEGRKGVALGDD